MKIEQQDSVFNFNSIHTDRPGFSLLLLLQPSIVVRWPVVNQLPHVDSETNLLPLSESFH